MEHETYCELVGRGAFFGGIVVTVDFGNAEAKITDPQTKKAIKFKSMIDAMNYMARQGWVFVNAYSITVKDSNIYHYIMRK